VSEPPYRPPSLLELPSYVAGQVSRIGRRYLAEELARHDLLLVHHAILCALSDFGPLSQQQVANALDLDKSHLVARIDQLEERGLARRERDPSDRRRHRVRLTSAGRRLQRELQPVALRSQQRLLDALPKPEQDSLLSQLQRVLEVHDAARFGHVEAPPLPPYTADDDAAPAL
jgi:DNA-binding MarR family transcriptional regulator